MPTPISNMEITFAAHGNYSGNWQVSKCHATFMLYLLQTTVAVKNDTYYN